MEQGKEALKIARNLIKVGRVNSVNSLKGTVKVLFEDRDNSISGDLPVFEFAKIPNVRDQVACIFLGNSIEVGFCLGRYYSAENLPLQDGGS